MGISLVLVKTDKKKEGNKWVSPVQIKYTYKGSYKRFPTNEFIEQKYWKEGSISTRYPKYSEIQKRISTHIKNLNEIITDIIENGGIPTPELVKLNYRKRIDTQLKKQPKPKRFWSSFEMFLRDKSRYGGGYTKSLKNLYNRMKDFEEFSKQTITYDYILFGRFEKDFKDYCLEIEVYNRSNPSKPIKGLSNNYVNKLFSNLKLFLNWSKEERIIQDVKKFKPLKTIRNDVLVYLNTEEVKKMYDYMGYNYPNKYKGGEVVTDIERDGKLIFWNNKELIKDIFTFQCSVGCRWGDIHKMTVGMFKIIKGSFVWTMEKTKDNVVVPENPISLGIFRKYSKGKSLDQHLFPKYSQQKFNKHLKEIGKELGFNRLVKREILVGSDIRDNTKKDKFTWELLSSHSGRRSFIKNLIDLGTMDTWSIMKLSGHRTISSFQKYVSVNPEDLLKGKELYGKELNELEQSDLLEKLRKLPKEVILKFLSEKL